MIILVIKKHLFDIYIYIYIYLYCRGKTREKEGDYPLRIKEPIFKGPRLVNV